MALRHRLASLYFPRSIEKACRKQVTAHGISILMYHEVLPDTMDIPYWHVVREAEFCRQMEYLAAHCTVLSIDKALAGLEAGRNEDAGPRPRVVITFDDGYRGNFDTALPILEQHGLPFVVYAATSRIESGGRYWYDDFAHYLLVSPQKRIAIPTSSGDIVFSQAKLPASRVWASVDACLTAAKTLPVGERDALATQLHTLAAPSPLQMMTPEQIGAMAAHRGATIGCHTHHHDLLDAVSEAEARGSILGAQEWLKQWCGNAPTHFSYPNGNYNDQVVRIVRDIGFRSAVTTQNRTAGIDDDHLTLPRIAIGRFDNLNMFRAKIAGAFDDVKADG